MSGQNFLNGPDTRQDENNPIMKQEFELSLAETMTMPDGEARDLEVIRVFKKYLKKVHKRLEPKYLFPVEAKEVPVIYTCNSCYHVTECLVRCVPKEGNEADQQRHSYCFKCWKETRKLPAHYRSCPGNPTTHTTQHIIGTGVGHFEQIMYEQYRRCFKGVVPCEHCQGHFDIAQYGGHKETCVEIYKQRRQHQPTPQEEKIRTLEQEVERLQRALSRQEREVKTAEQVQRAAERQLRRYEVAGRPEFRAKTPQEKVIKLRAENALLKETIAEDQKRLRLQTTHGEIQEALDQMRKWIVACELMREDMEDIVTHQKEAMDALHHLNEAKDWNCKAKIQRVLFRSRLNMPKHHIPAKEFVADPWCVRRAAPVKQPNNYKMRLTVINPRFPGGQWSKVVRLHKPLKALYGEWMREMKTDEPIHLVGMGMLKIESSEILSDEKLKVQHLAFQNIEDNRTTEMTIQCLSTAGLSNLLGIDDIIPKPHSLIVREVGRREPNGPLEPLMLETICNNQHRLTNEFLLDNEERYINQYYIQFLQLRKSYVEMAETSLYKLQHYYAKLARRYPGLISDQRLRELNRKAEDIFPWLREDEDLDATDEETDEGDDGGGDSHDDQDRPDGSDPLGGGQPSSEIMDHDGSVEDAAEQSRNEGNESEGNGSMNGGMNEVPNEVADTGAHSTEDDGREEVPESPPPQVRKKKVTKSKIKVKQQKISTNVEAAQVVPLSETPLAMDPLPSSQSLFTQSSSSTGSSQSQKGGSKKSLTVSHSPRVSEISYDKMAAPHDRSASIERQKPVKTAQPAKQRSPSGETSSQPRTVPARSPRPRRRSPLNLTGRLAKYRKLSAAYKASRDPNSILANAEGVPGGTADPASAVVSEERSELDISIDQDGNRRVKTRTSSQKGGQRCSGDPW